jgi:energy-converting hydrogenase Eha subunit B
LAACPHWVHSNFSCVVRFSPDTCPQAGQVREKIEQRLDSTVDRRVRRQLAEQLVVARGNRAPSDPGGFGERFGFGIISLIMAIPLSAIASGQAGLPGLVVAWLGIVGVNVVHASRSAPWAHRRQRESASDWEG